MYGTEAGVAALVPTLLSGAGVFTANTRPTYAQVTSWLGQVSAMLDSVLAQNGFDTPITEATVTPMLDMFINEEVAAIAEGVNGSGRFGPTGKEPHGKGRFAIILSDVEAFVARQGNGFERMGAARTYPSIYGIDSKTYNRTGDEVYALFQREAFGERTINWDEDE